MRFAADNHGLITSAQARDIGVSNNELVQYARRGRVLRVGQGLYQLSRWVPEPNDVYAWAVATVGPEALLYGESVIAMLGLAPTNPNRFFVATPRHSRRRLPENITVKWIRGIEPGTGYDGIFCQCVCDAILACSGKMLPERLRAAAHSAYEQGLVDSRQYHRLMDELEAADVT